MPQGSDNSPASCGSSRSHGKSADDLNPGGNFEVFSWFGTWSSEKGQPTRGIFKITSDSTRDQRESDNAHGLLGIICAMHKAHGPSADDLKTSENSVYKPGAE